MQHYAILETRTTDDLEDMAQYRLRIPQFVSVTEAAKITGVNRATIHRWIKNGKLEATSIGRTNLILRDDVHALAQQRRSAALATWTEQEIPASSDFEVRVEDTDDPKTILVKYIAPGGRELVGTCRFDENPSEWIESVKDALRKAD